MNVCRALHVADHEVIGIDDNLLHLAWAEPYCTEVRYLSMGSDLEVDLVHAQPENFAYLLASSDFPKLMPTPATMATCQHKPTAGMIWHAAGLRRFAPVTIGQPLLENLDFAAEMFALPFWLRAAVGAGARCATLVEDVKTGFHWVKYWETRTKTIEWVAEEYLPGRDFCWTGVYRNGVFYAGFARERLEWLYPHLAPSGRTGTPTISQVVHDERLNATAHAAVEAVDAEPNGIYCVDLREDREGIPRPTEINAGRWATTSPLYFELGPNLPDLHARLASGETIQPWGDDIYPAGVKLLRHIDCGHVFLPPETNVREPHRILAVA